MPESIHQRKNRHLEICLNPRLPVENGDTGFDSLRLPHRSIPSADRGNIDLGTDFLGYRLKLPLMISCMTGGSDEGRRLNRLLAGVAGERGIAFGLGSIRVMLEDPGLTADFLMRSRVPDVPLLANIGAAQLGQYPVPMLTEAIKRLEADGLYVHLNAGQELFQDRGDIDFTEWKRDLLNLIEAADFPVLVKETGAGIPPVEGVELLEHGAAYLDVAGAGGTDWISVESLRDKGASGVDETGFRGWGYPTAELLLAYRFLATGKGRLSETVRDRIIASGGLRTPLDYAKSLAAGAWIAAAALPFIRAASEGGEDAVHRYIDTADEGIRNAVVLTGCRNLDGFRTLSVQADDDIQSSARRLADEVHGSSPR